MTDKVRRNGQLSSCEPCRKSKLRCDHGRPQCERCIRRNLPQQQCYYHPAPLAGHKRSQDQHSLTPPPRIMQRSSETISHTILSTTSTTGAIDRGTGLVSMENPLFRFDDVQDMSSFRTFASLTRNGVATAPVEFQPSKSELAEVVEIFELILDIPAEVNAFCATFIPDDMMVSTGGVLAHAAWLAVNKVLPRLQAQRSKCQLIEVARNSFKQTSQPLVLPKSATNSAVEKTLSTGALRLETLGLYCVLMSVYMSAVSDYRIAALKHAISRAEWISRTSRIFEASMACERLSARAGQVNDLTLSLMLWAVNPSTWIFGDDSYRTWRLAGDLVSVVMALGLHKGVSTSGSVPVYLVECRRQAIAMVYEHELRASTFVGRPVRLSRLYCIIDIPLDLTNQEIMGCPQQLTTAISNLDDGWNKTKQVDYITGLRGRVIYLKVREEVLELSLGQAGQELTAKLEPIMGRLNAARNSMLHLRHAPTQWEELPYPVPAITHTLELEYLYTRFLIEKLLVNEENGDLDILIKTSHEILSLVLSTVKRRELLVSHRVNMEFILISFAMPCASVLLLELFRQVRQPGKSRVLSSYSIIRDIGVLVSSCDWLTEPGRTNYEFCKQAQALFSRSLDQICSMTTVRSPSNVAMVDEADTNYIQIPRTPSIVEGLDDYLTQDPEWIAWMDSYDLHLDPWLDLPE